MFKRFKEGELIKVMSFMKTHKWKYIFTMIANASFISICYNVVLAFIMKDVINAITYKDVMLMKRAVYIAGISFVSAFILQPIINYLLKGFVRKTMGDIRLKVFKHVEKLTVENLENHQTGDLISRMTNDVETIQGVYKDQIPSITFALIHGIVAVISMFIMEWRLAILVIVIGLLSVFISTVFSKPLRKTSDEVQKKQGELTQKVIDIMDGFQVIKMFNIQEKIYKKYKNSNKELYTYSFKNEKINCVLRTVKYFYGNVQSIGVLSVGLYMSLKGIVDIGTIVAIIQLQGNANFLFENIGDFISGIQKSLAGAARVFELLEIPTEKEKIRVCDNVEDFSSNTIEMKKVKFGYKGVKEVLKDINISVGKGEIAAIVGPSGGGKSTIIKLLMKFYKVDRGEIYIGGKPLACRTIKDLRNMIAYVPQDSYLFHGTIEENIRYGKIDASKEEIIEATRAAYAHDFIMSLPDGYDTVVGEMGSSLSGGQRQRIAISRALLKNAPILLLDEATSALDSESEQLVQRALNTLMKGRTTIAVAHRLSTIENSDIIYVMENGVVVEKGKHNELLEKDGVYNRLYELPMNA